jgi:hypothetical protein
MSRLKPWDQIKDQYSDILVLGNGASVAVDKVFDYRSLKELAVSKRRITPDLETIFRLLDTEDFELVLNMLWQTSRINRALKISDNRSSEAYDQIKRALIQTIQEHHVTRESITAYLEPMYTFMGNFKTIVSLNYDLLVYWAMMEGNASGMYEFKDCFNSDEFRYDDWRKLREPIRGCKYSTLVFYPHGNLVLATVKDNSDKKISKGRSPILLDSVLNTWRNDEGIPLFVSEGTSPQKLKAIGRSRYLNTIYSEVIPTLRGSVLIYGWDMHDNDQHLLRRLIEGKERSVAIAVYEENKSDEGVKKKCDRLDKQIRKYHPTEVNFFDANDQGCWIHTPC